MKVIRGWFLIFVCCTLFMAAPVHSEDRGLTIVTRGAAKSPSQAEQRTALVIGNGTYESSPLQNPVNDAKAMGDALRILGFDVTERENLDQKQMKQEIQSFGEKLQNGGVGLFYFAGHGMQVDGRNYLIPIGAKIEHERQVEYEAVDAGSVLAEMDHARNRLNIVVLDACRDNPFGRSFRSTVKGLASMDAPVGTLIGYSTAPGSVASDGQGENSPYAHALITYMQKPGMKIEDVFKHVRTLVRQETDGKQTPWEASSLEGDFYFKAPTVAAAATSAPAEMVQTPSTSPPATRSEARAPVKVWKEPVTGMEFIWVPAGCYQMGSRDSEQGRESDEGPVHEVCVQGFWMSKNEVTNGQFRKFHPQHNSKDYEGISLNGDDQPVVYVSWGDAGNFAKWLIKQDGDQYKFRLPTEAEWEYACRAGTDSPRYWGDDPSKACTYENVADQSAKRRWSWDGVHECDDSYIATAPVGSFQANPFGLHDMLGNVSEWCQDIYNSDTYSTQQDSNKALYSDSKEEVSRVIRGGHWHSGPAGTRCAIRASGLPGGMNDNLGFRLVREP